MRTRIKRNVVCSSVDTKQTLANHRLMLKQRHESFMEPLLLVVPEKENSLREFEIGLRNKIAEFRAAYRKEAVL